MGSMKLQKGHKVEKQGAWVLAWILIYDIIIVTLNQIHFLIRWFNCIFSKLHFGSKFLWFLFKFAFGFRREFISLQDISISLMQQLWSFVRLILMRHFLPSSGEIVSHKEDFKHFYKYLFINIYHNLIDLAAYVYIGTSYL